MSDPSESPARLAELSVFLPCYNEAENIRRVAGEVRAFLPEVADDFELILVDDGSADGTGELADALADEDEHIRAVHHETNRGYGGALQSGFRAAGKAWVFYTDGDGQFDIRELPRLLPHAGEYDIVSGYREHRSDSPVRRLNAWLWGLLVKAVLGFRSRDVDSAFKLYRREIFDAIAMKSTGALIDAEILARARRAGYTLKEVPVSHRPRVAGEQTGANLAVILRAFRELWKLRADIRATPRARPAADAGAGPPSPSRREP